MKTKDQALTSLDGVLAMLVIAVMYIVTYMIVKFIPRDACYPIRAILACLPVYAIIATLLLLRRQTPISIGLNKNSMFYAAILVITLAVGIKALSQENTELIAHWLFYLVAVGGTEELVFRGYAHDRMVMLCKSQIIAFFVMGMLFGAAHHISEMVWNDAALSGVLWTLGGGIAGQLLFCFVWKRTGNIASAILLHACLDFAPYWIGGIVLCAIFLLPTLILGEKRLALKKKENV